MTTDATVLTPGRGEVVTHHGHLTWLLSACEEQNVAYSCVTHELDFPTKHHAKAHVAEPGEHVIVRWCPKHGLETAAKPTHPPTP